MADAPPELAALRAEIAAVDRTLLDALNRRLELVKSVRAHKDATNVRFVDAERESALLRELESVNRGPLSDRGVNAIFSAVLDVMKQELQIERPAAPSARPQAAGIERVAIIGTGLLGTSVGLAAGRAGVASVAAFDADATRLRQAATRAALDARSSVAEAVSDAQLVVVAVPVGSAVAAIREVLAAAPDDATVTDVASTKRSLTESFDDPRFVPGHPVAGGETSGPDRATAELFDGATWFLTPGPGADAACVETVQRFVSALGARPLRREAVQHDRLLALTSHLPHALANALMRIAAGEPGALESAGASFREMTRVAGANTSVWTDIFLENGDLIAGAVASLRAELETLERALADGDRPYLERSIADAQESRNELLSHAYQAEAGQLHRIRIRVPDRPGVLARITQILGAASVNIEDFELRHVSPEYGGVLVILVMGAETAELARTLLRSEGYAAA
ncbi:MAG TPA: prephenate dehydrogenase/arogenate dehydrogenase family protein [Gaiellaceae bacterium]|nr:prephenate dehydrogenase/arogenate dehydrogenase family protein [Gaiellaceae bacterium]